MITQARFSKSVKFFEPKFLERWNLSAYDKVDIPTFFAGVYRPEDVEAVNNHKGFKVVWNPGALRSIFSDVNPVDAYVMIGNGINVKIDPAYKQKNVNIPIKDFSLFNTTPLGNRIYAYMGRNNDSCRKSFHYDFVRDIEQAVGIEVIYGYQGHTERFIKEQYYDQCFLNIKICLTGGLTTATEMAYMGRKTISNTKAPFCFGYNNLADVVSMVKEESSRIGSVSESLIPHDFFVGDEWLQEEFWL